jgi:hypothetical protein
MVVERREVSDDVVIGPLALAHRPRSHSRSKSRSKSRGGRRELRAEIRALEREYKDRELIRAERLPTGELVLYEEEEIEVVKPSRGGARIEKDKKGRMSISVPKNR